MAEGKNASVQIVFIHLARGGLPNPPGWQARDQKTADFPLDLAIQHEQVNRYL